jgi:hypothetical protein
MASKKKPQVTKGAARQLRMSPDLEARILAYQKELRDKFGIENNFSSTVRTLIEKGLKAEWLQQKRGASQ